MRGQRTRLLVVTTVLLAVGGAAGVSSATASSSLPDGASARELGITFAGLRKDAACGQAYRVEATLGGAARCSHGPDPAPSGVDASRPRPVEELREDAATTTSTTGAPAAVPCYGDGTTGKRVQAVYAHAADVPGRFAEVAPLIQQYAANVDDVVADSAAKTGGVRHVLWVTSGCVLDVLDVTMSATGDDDYASTQRDLYQAGLTRTDRKYLVWVDANVYCGIADFVDDDSAGRRNKSNSGPTIARVDQGCWGKPEAVEAHELFHTLGAVQYSAPNSSLSGHCLDESDRLCYRDSIYVETHVACDAAQERLLDCGNDDYFHTAPPSGSYLASHWNTANSEFLTSALPGTTTTTTKSGGGKGGGRR